MTQQHLMTAIATHKGQIPGLFPDLIQGESRADSLDPKTVGK
jgi:hypothetical protein